MLCRTDMCGLLYLPLGAGRFIPLTITTTMSVLLSSGNILERKERKEKGREKYIKKYFVIDLKYKQ